MSPEPPDDLRALLDRARDYLRGRDDLRATVEALGHALTALAQWSSAESASPVSAAPAPPTQTPGEPALAPKPTPPPLPPPPPVPIESLPPLTFATAPSSTPTPTPGHWDHAHGEVVPEPLETIARRCRLKADACRYAALRDAGGAHRDELTELFHRAKALPDCYLWMFEDQAYTDDPRVWGRLAEAFEAAAAAAEMLRSWWELPTPHRERAASDVLHVAAEAQGVLYAAIAAARRLKADGDQVQLFVTIRQEAARIRVFISRYLKREDRADPAAGPDVSRRVRELAHALQRYAGTDRSRQKGLGNLGFKARRLLNDPAAAAEEWPRIVELVDELVAGGLPPSSAQLRDVLLPLIDLVPDELPQAPGMARALLAIDEYLATRHVPDDAPADEPWSAEVAEVRALLGGRQVVLIGGQLRPENRDALIEAFNLDDLRWITTNEHESILTFEAPIARANVAVVLLAIRWSSHSFGDVQEFCDRHGKLLVRLPSGYNPNQVAHQILAQVGHRLRAAG